MKRGYTTMNKIARKTIGTRVALAVSVALLLPAALPVRAGTVYRPGLWQAPLSGDANWKADILSAAGVERAPGTMMAEITKAAGTNNPITRTTFNWGDYQTWGYAGQMYMRGGVTYHFYKFVDDSGNYVVDGETILKNHTSHDKFAHCQYIPQTTGWKGVDLRFGNGSGGAGRSGLFGAGWNTNGVSANQIAGWEHIADPGDCTLLRVATGESFSGAALRNMWIDSSGLTLVLSCTNLPAGATLYALTDTADRGTDLMSDWANAVNLGSVPSGNGENTYLFANAVPSGIMRLVVVSPGLSSDSFVEWLAPVDLSSVAMDGALTVGATVTAQYDAIDVSVFVPSLGPVTSVELQVDLSQDPDFAAVLKTKSLGTATSTWYTKSVLFDRLTPDAPYYVRVTATPNVGDPIVKVYPTATLNPGPVFTARVNTDHLAPEISLSFTDVGWGDSITRITVQASASGNFTRPDASTTLDVNLTAMPTNVADIVLVGLPRSSPLQYQVTAWNSKGHKNTVDLSVVSSVGGDNVWSGRSRNIADENAYVFAGGLPAFDKTLFFTSPAGLSPIIDQDTVMPLLRFTNGKDESVETDNRNGYHSCGYDLAGTGLLTFYAEKPILQGSKGTNVVRNPILFHRSNNQTVNLFASGGRFDLTGKLELPSGITNTTMSVSGNGNGEIHFGGPSPDFMGTLSLNGNSTLSLDNPNAMTNVSRIYFGSWWGSYSYLKNNTGVPMTFPRCETMNNETGYDNTRINYTGAPFIFPVGTLVWGPRDWGGSTIGADLVVQNVQVTKHGSNTEAGLEKNGNGTLIVMGTTSWSSHDCKHYIRLRNGCFWAQTPAGLPPSGEFFVPDGSDHQSTLGLGGDYSPMLDGSSIPRVFQSSTKARWGFTGFGGDRTVRWNADPTLNLTNTASGEVKIKLSNAVAVTSIGTAYTNYYAYPACFMFGNRSEFADGTILFLNPIRYELGQNWDTSTFFESTNHVVAARMRGSLKLGNRDKTWNFSGRNFGGYLALEAENADFTGKVNVTEKGNLLVNSNLVARAVTVQTGSGLGGAGSLQTADGTTVKSGGALFGGEWNRDGTLTIGGKVTLEGGSALRAQIGASNDRVGYVKLAPGSTLKLGSPVYVDIDTDPRVSPIHGAPRKVLDWSEASFDSGHAPTIADFTARPGKNSDIRRMFLFVRDDALYVNYLSGRTPPATVLLLR